MKKLFALIISALFISVYFTSCFSPIFYEIMNDVAPESATVSGNILSIARFKTGGTEYLAVAADGGLRYKKADNQTHGSWATYNLSAAIPGFSFHTYDNMTTTHNGYQLVKVLADDEYLYLIAATYTNYNDYGITGIKDFYIWAIKPEVNADGSWSTTNTGLIAVTIPENLFPTYISNEIQYTAFSIFSTNAPQNEHRAVFIRSGLSTCANSSYTTPSYYQLNQGSITSYTPVAFDSSTTDYSSVVWYNGYKFSSAKVATTDETYSAPPTRIYYGSGSTLRYSDTTGSNFTDAFTTDYPIITLTTTADSILIGRGFPSSSSTVTYGGMIKTSLTNGVPGSSSESFSTNCAFKLTAAYYILAAINATPDQTETNSILYASMTFYGTGTSSSVSFSDIGLWSYYPTRGNWNRE